MHNLEGHNSDPWIFILLVDGFLGSCGLPSRVKWDVKDSKNGGIKENIGRIAEASSTSKDIIMNHYNSTPFQGVANLTRRLRRS